MAKEKITKLKLDSEVNKAKEQAKEQGKDQKLNCGGGLYVCVRKTGKAVFQARTDHSWVTLGDYDKMELVNAWKKTEQEIARDKRTEHVKRERLTDPVFGDFFLNRFIPHLQEANRTSSRIATVKSHYNSVLAVLADYHLQKITPAVIDDLLAVDKLPPSRQGTISKANRNNAITTLQQCLDYAVTMQVLKYNPLAGLKSLPEYKRIDGDGFAFVKADELKEKFFDKLKSLPEMNLVYYLLTALTVCRKSETRLMKWEWISFDPVKDAPNGIITVPADFTKTSVIHEIPMTSVMSTLLRNWKVKQVIKSDYVFPNFKGDKPQYERSFDSPITQNTAKDITLHGLRKSYNTYISAFIQEKKYTETVIQMVLAHETRSKVVRAYDHYEYLKEKLEILEFWGKKVVSQLPDEYLKLIQ